MTADLEALEALLAKGTRGPWYHYDGVFRARFGQSRVTEIQRERDGKPIISWGGFDGLDAPMNRKKNHNAALIVAAVNALPTLIAALRAKDARIAELEAALVEAREMVEQWGAYADESATRHPTLEPHPRLERGSPSYEDGASPKCLWGMVDSGGLEPPTFRLRGERSTD